MLTSFQGQVFSSCDCGERGLPRSNSMLPIPAFLHARLCWGYEYVLLNQCSSSHLPLFTRGNIYNLTLKPPHSASNGRHPINIPSCLWYQASSQDSATWIALNCIIDEIYKVIFIKLLVRCWPLWQVACALCKSSNNQLKKKSELKKKSNQSERIR